MTPEEKARALAGDVVVVAGNRAGLSGGLQVSAVGGGSGADRVTVVAALPTADLESATRTLRNLLLVVFPLLLLVWPSSRGGSSAQR